MKYLLLSVLLILGIGTSTSAQTGFPGGGSPPVEAPIDGGLSLLAAAGGAYAFKRLKDKKMRNDELD
jgi:hypothetical protein